MEIPFASSKHAAIAKQAIEVDAILQPHAVKRELLVQDEKLIGYVKILQYIKVSLYCILLLYRTFRTLTVRLARLELNGFLENVDLIARTIENFAPDISSEIS